MGNGGKMMALRKIALGACMVIALAGVGGCSLLTPGLDEAEPESVEQTVDDAALVTPGTLTVALNTNDAPQAMVTGEGVEGYEVDVARALAREMGLDLALVSASSPDDPLSEGEADIFVGATTGDAGGDITVLGSCLEDATAIFGKVEGDATRASAADLAAAVIGVQESSASQEALAKAGIVSDQETYANVNACFDALASGEVDYVACDATAGAYLARAYEGVGFMGTISAVSSQGIAVSASATELLDAVSDAFDAISSDGVLAAVHASWYGQLPLSLSDQTVSGVQIASTSADDEAPSGDLNSIGD